MLRTLVTLRCRALHLLCLWWQTQGLVALQAHDIPGDTLAAANAFSADQLPQVNDFVSSSQYHPRVFLPSVDCVRVISLNGSAATRAPLIAQLKRLGLWERTTVQIEQRDPDGGRAGCFRAHVRAWNLGRQCSHQLVLEDDAFFDNGTVELSAARADMFLGEGFAYDLLLLGWGSLAGINVQAGLHVSQIDHAGCAFNLHGPWTQTHAYVIAKAAMRKFSNLTYEGEHLDVSLAARNDTRFTTVRPKSAFQYYHETTVEWSSNPFEQKVLEHGFQKPLKKMEANPDFSRRSEDKVYEASGYGDLCAA